MNAAVSCEEAAFDAATLDDRKRHLAYAEGAGHSSNAQANSANVLTATPVGPFGCHGCASWAQAVQAISRWAHGSPPVNSFRNSAAVMTPEYGRLSVMLQAYFAMQKLFRVAPGAFRPPPKVDSAVVRMVPLGAPLGCDEKVFEQVVREAFSARRKTLRNALPLSADQYAELGMDARLRPENLSPQDYVRIALRVGRGERGVAVPGGGNGGT